MSIRTFFVGAFALLACGAVPALGQQTNHVPPGNPCGAGPGVGTSNPCKGNNGNVGAQGHSNRERVVYDTDPAPLDIPMSPVTSRGAFVSQIGDANVATIRQGVGNAFGLVAQSGDRNAADIRQAGDGDGYAQARQTGDANSALIAQSGAGQNVILVTQTGNANSASGNQTADGIMHNGAIMTQIGDGNVLALVQDGADNRALMTQTGDYNQMTAVQNGVGNQLAWRQNGNNLSNLGVTQSGGQAMQITQTGNGR